MYLDTYHVDVETIIPTHISITGRNAHHLLYLMHPHFIHYYFIDYNYIPAPPATAPPSNLVTQTV